MTEALPEALTEALPDALADALPDSLTTALVDSSVQATLNALLVSSARAYNASAYMPADTLVGLPVPVPGGPMAIPRPEVDGIPIQFPETMKLCNKCQNLKLSLFYWHMTSK